MTPLLSFVVLGLMAPLVALVLAACAVLGKPISERRAGAGAALALLALALAPFVARQLGGSDFDAIDLPTSTGVATFGTRGVGPWVALFGTLLALSAFGFGRRYLHRESGFSRYCVLCLAFVFGFDLVCLGTTLDLVLIGWELVGLASTFLIAFYTDRPSARRNGVFAFTVYRLGDVGLLLALVALQHDHGSLSIATVGGRPFPHAPLFAMGLCLAAACKSSQFPLTSLFARSMEGPTPTSALGYAGLSAHLGVVLLVRTAHLWGAWPHMRVVLMVIGALTMVHAMLVGSVRADRKGALGYATAGTVGALFVVLGLGLPRLALLGALGHAALRMTQIARAPSALADAKRLAAALGGALEPRIVPSVLFELAWRLRRFDHDLPNLLLGGLHSRLRVRARAPRVTPKAQEAR